ncbi:hypothetical protein ACFW9D_22840 [Streptomyces sp. NPDC059524]|uniref:hypothetical protein n=1 Tax=Streptomyces sp. NPDC059524 TaxID=3346856 RepID=UPI0036C37741
MTVIRSTAARAAALALLFTAALFGASAAPARADGAAVALHVPENAYLTKRGVGPTGGTRIWLDPSPGGGLATRAGVELKVDASDLAGTARLRTRRDCGDHTWTTQPFTCDLGTLTRGKRNYPDALYIEAAPGARAGAHGTIRYTFSAPGSADATFETEVWVGGADLRERVEKPRRDLTAGGDFEFTPHVRNAGKVPAHGFGVEFSSPRLNFRTQYSNCWYADTRSAYCWFDRTLDPGRSYAFASPITVGVPDETVNSSFQYNAYLSGLTGNAEDPATAFTTDADPGLKRGKGPELTVREVAGAASGYNDEYSLGETKVSTTQTADLKAGAGELAGRTGTTADVTFSLRNAGPGRVYGAYMEITPPEGTSVVEPTPPPDPDNELEWQWECGSLGGGKYSCRPDHPLEPGENWKTTLRFKLDQRVRDAEGRLDIKQGSSRPAKDPRPADNTVPVVTKITGGPLVEPSKKPVAETAKASSDGGGSGGPGGPVLAAGAGALVVAAGLGALWVRRMRARRQP